MKEYKVFYMKDNEDLADILHTYATIGYSLKNIFKFPPLIDSFLSPRETQLNSYLEDINSYRWIPLISAIQYNLVAD